MKFLKIFTFTITVLLFFGCVSVPDTINEKYLQDTTSEEDANINSLTSEIITKRKEKNEAEETYKISEKTFNSEKSKLSIYEKELEVLEDKVELYNVNKDMVKLSEVSSEKEIKEKQIKDQEIILKYSEADMDYKSSDFEVKTAELGVLVSQLEYEKAKIAKRNKEKIDQKNKPKTQNAPKEKKNFFQKFFSKEDKDEIQIEKYQKYYEDQKSFLKSALKKRSAAEEKLNAIKPDYEKLDVNSSNEQDSDSEDENVK